MTAPCPRCGYTEEIRDAATEARERALDAKIEAMTSSCETIQARLRNAAQEAIRGLERI